MQSNLQVADVSTKDDTDGVKAEASKEFVNTAYVRDVTNRATSYLEVGYPVHLNGPAGIGKTTLAFHIAAQLGRPVTLINGDDQFESSDLIGNNSGYKKSRVVDNYIHRVLKTEEEYSSAWQDNRLTTACKHGYTLIYDEFTRSRPEANNTLLSVLEEKILNLPYLKSQGDGYLEVHPEFRAIFTSNPEEYCGVHKTQDALMDRLINISMDHFDIETEINIAIAKSGICEHDARVIVSIVRELRKLSKNNYRPTIRAIIAISKITAHQNARAKYDDSKFFQICCDVLGMDILKVDKNRQMDKTKKLKMVINKICQQEKSDD